jgi:hypothetical protein
MEVIENAVAQMAGYGLKIFFVLQSLEQLKAIYKDNWETFLANSGVKVFFNLEDHFSREYVSKLIGETEVIRDVRSASDSSGESESLSHGASRSRSESTGDSTSHGSSVSEGTNRSTSDSESKGVNRSEGNSFGDSGTINRSAGLFGTLMCSHITGHSSSASHSTSSSKGTSEGWSRSRTEGASRGSSASLTEGTSHTDGSSAGESVGTTKGSSQSRTTGASETIHRRALISPDEIGQAFASVKDRTLLVYPGLALVLISGERPMYLRRVNYYEDDEFIGLFTPHPDHTFRLPELHIIDFGVLAAYRPHFSNLFWRVKVPSGAIVREGDAIGDFYDGLKNYKGDRLDVHIAPLRAPRAGRVLRLPDDLNSKCAILSYDISYYGISLFRPADPCMDLAIYCKNMERKEKEEWQEKENLKAKLKAFPNPPDNPLLERPLAKRGTGLLEESDPIDKWVRSLPPSGNPASKGPDVKIPKKSEEGMFSRMVDKLLRKFF